MKNNFIAGVFICEIFKNIYSIESYEQLVLYSFRRTAPTTCHFIKHAVRLNLPGKTL